MGASRKLQGEIDRVLKKVQEGVDVFDSIWNKVYDTDNINQKEKFEADLKKEIKKLQRYRDQIKTWIQSSEIKDKKALMDARKVIEREMERFKICEKETKTKAFSKEGLGQQPKTDPREKAKSETRDWLNNVVCELENQIDSFEAEMEGLQGKKGKTRPPRLMHLETSIARHKAHIMKLELILRLLDNDELSPEQVNDVKDFLDDYVERNQDDFDEFSDVDELYSSLPLDKVESLEDLVTVGSPAITKNVSSSITAVKPALSTAPTQHAATTVMSIHLPASAASDQGGGTSPHEDITPRTPPTKIGALSMSATQTPAAAQVTPGVAANAALSVIISSATKDEDTTKSPISKPSPAISESGIQPVGRGVVSGQSTPNILPTSGKSIPSSGLGAISSPSDVGKRNLFGSDDRAGSPGIVQSPLSNRVLLSQAKVNDGLGSADTDAAALGSRVFTSPVVPGMQWRPGASFQNQSETGQIRGRAEIAPDQREKFLQRLQQVQQQGQSNILSMPPLAGGKPYTPQQPGLLLQQFNAQGPSISPQLGSLGIGVPTSGGNSVATSAPLQPQLQSPVFQSSTQPAMFSTTSKDAETKNEDLQQQHPLPEDSAVATESNSGLGKNLLEEDETNSSYAVDAMAGVAGTPSMSEPSQVTVETDLSIEQPLQASPSSGNLGAIGRERVSDLGTIGDSISPSNASGAMHDHLHYVQMLDAAFHRLPQPRDSERSSYMPRHPAVTPTSYPQVQAPIINNPAFWDRLAGDTDTLFFTFYYQQNTYQQYLAARSLKKHAWRFHRKYNTWFQRHVEPHVTTEEYEQGTYVYFDYNIANEEHGWRQKIKNDFIFEYSFLEDECYVLICFCVFIICRIKRLRDRTEFDWIDEIEEEIEEEDDQRRGRRSRLEVRLIHC